MRPPGPTLPAASRHPGTLLPRLPALAACCALLAGLPAMAQNPATATARLKAPAVVAKAPKPGAPAKPAKPAKPASSHQQLSDQAKGLALATATTEAISTNQLDIAARVLTGAADCEFKQTVQVLALPGKPGLFGVEHKGKRYVMAPRETSTGAVRLEDPSAGVVWLQIPAKSMLMNARIGQRMVDGCQHSEQRAATLAVAGAAQTLGIEAPKAAAAPETSAVAAAPAASAASAASAESATPAASAAPAAPAASAAPATPATPATPAASAAPAAPAASH